MALIAFRRGRWVFDRKGNDGIRKVTTCKDKDDAQKKLDRYTKRLELGLPPDEDESARKKKRAVIAKSGDAVLISNALKQFEQVVMSGKRKPKTLKIERQFLRALYESLYEQEIFYVADITSQHVDTFYAQLQKDYAAASVNRIFGLHKQFFKTMVRWGLLAKDPSEGIGQLRVKPKPKKVWTSQAFELAMAKFPEWSRPVLRFIRETGCRPGQATGLKWSDVNLETRTWHTMSEKGRLKEPKELFLPLPPSLVPMLTELKSTSRKRFKAKAEDPVFLNAEGTGPIRPDYLYTIIRRAGETKEGRPTELKGLCPSGLRTTFGTVLTGEGMPLKYVAELMGHSDTRTTERWYVKDVSNEVRKAFEERFKVKG